MAVGLSESQLEQHKAFCPRLHGMLTLHVAGLLCVDR